MADVLGGEKDPTPQVLHEHSSSDQASHGLHPETGGCTQGRIQGTQLRNALRTEIQIPRQRIQLRDHMPTVQGLQLFQDECPDRVLFVGIGRVRNGAPSGVPKGGRGDGVAPFSVGGIPEARMVLVELHQAIGATSTHARTRTDAKVFVKEH